MEEDNIIAIYNKNQRCALEYFDTFINDVNAEMNRLAMTEGKYADCHGTKLEGAVVDMMKEMCINTSFRPDDIELVSGLHFPDIVAGKHFGVEVKTSQSKNWTSIGSSIVESTRIEDVNHIYMLFGNMGLNPVEFKCKPYQECMYDITVTHSPRYLINMNISHDETIFSKMNIDYDVLRKKKEIVKEIRNYYIEKAEREKIKEIPWWLEQETILPATLKIWNAKTISNKESSVMISELLILFPNEICCSAYDRPALWLCINRGFINTHFRDLFTSGGYQILDGITYSALGKRIISRLPEIKDILDSGSLDIAMMEYNNGLYTANNKMEYWMNQIINSQLKDTALKSYLKERIKNGI